MDKFGIVEAKDYMRKMRNAVGSHLSNANSIYYGKEGHLRLARECGVALNDFDGHGQQQILHASYGSIYVIGCNLRPILDAGEWIGEMNRGYEKVKQKWK